jgi:hypothetical protein
MLDALRAAVHEASPGNAVELLGVIDAAEATPDDRAVQVQLATIEAACATVPVYAGLLAARQRYLGTLPWVAARHALRGWEGDGLPPFRRTRGLPSPREALRHQRQRLPLSPCHERLDLARPLAGAGDAAGAERRRPMRSREVAHLAMGAAERHDHHPVAREQRPQGEQRRLPPAAGPGAAEGSGRASGECPGEPEVCRFVEEGAHGCRGRGEMHRCAERESMAPREVSHRRGRLGALGADPAQDRLAALHRRDALGNTLRQRSRTAGRAVECDQDICHDAEASAGATQRESGMIVEWRAYTTRTGKTRAFIELMRTRGLPIQEAVQGKIMAMYTYEFGPQEHVVMLWRYDSLADREARRAKLATAPGWAEFVAEASDLVQHHETRLMNPVPL